MKNSLFSILLTLLLATSFSFAMISCGGAQTEEAQAMYACPMHPEVTGKEGDSCNQCGMALEEMETAEEHAQH